LGEKGTEDSRQGAGSSKELTYPATLLLLLPAYYSPFSIMEEREPEEQEKAVQGEEGPQGSGCQGKDKH
jgi:hypothetical protein